MGGERERERREEKRNRKGNLCVDERYKGNKDSLYVENEKKQSCKRTVDENTNNKSYIKLNTTLTRGWKA